MQKRSVFIVGGTGLGKSKLGILLSQALNGEVINADAMQLYSALPVATAQPSKEEQQTVPHHLFSRLDSHEHWTVREYRDQAQSAMDAVWTRDRVPFVVGGTLYYSQALIWRALLDEQRGYVGNTSRAELVGNATELYEQLVREDPRRAAELHPNDVRKVERSLQIVRETGRSSVEFVENTDEEAKLDCIVLWVDCQDQALLEERLRARIDVMLNNGLVEEARQFKKDNEVDFEEKSKGVFQAIGFREIDPLIHRTEPGPELPKEMKDACAEQLVIKHRQYVRTQLKWIKHRLITRKVPVFRLDATDLSAWNENVFKNAEKIVRCFLEQGNVPESIFPTCNVEKPQDERKKMKFTCEACNKTIIGGNQWDQHIQSRSHRKRMESIQRKQLDPTEVVQRNVERKKRTKVTLETENM